MTTFTGTDDDDIVTMTAAQWASFDVIDLGRGTDVLNVVVEGTINISALVAPSIVNVETGILSSTIYVNVTLTGEQLDAIIIGAGKIDFRRVDQNTINLKSTSADLNTLANGSITGVVRIDASLATAGVTMNLSGERGHAMGEFEVTGSSFADTIIGGSGEGYISGGAGADTIIGGESNDVIDGGAGADTIVCYSSEVIYDGSDISIDGGGERSTLIVTGAATINLSLLDQTSGDTANVTGFDNVFATYSTEGVSLTGNANANAFRGGDGADTINGGGGDDRIEADNGADTVMGGGGDDTIEAGNGADWIDGGDGDDTIDGSTWSDDWSEDPDTLNGGAGDDTLVLSIGATTIDLNSSSDQTIGDTAIVTGFENVDASDSSTAVSLTGDANANELTGSRYADAIDGGDGDDTIHYWWEGGADTLNGGAGSDTLIVSRDATVDLNSLSDQTIGDTAIATGFENVASTYGAASLTGDANANVLTGGTGNDTITGGAGADTIGGGGGDDTLNGGAGNDTLIVGGAETFDGIVGGGATIDLSSSSAQTTGNTSIVTGFENVDASGSVDAVNLTGDASANTITGSNGDDTLNGGGGNDTITGGSGNDTITGGAGADTIAGGAGDDTITGGTGEAGSRLYGATGDDKITGGNGADRISGGAGADTIAGGNGADRIDGGAGDADTINGGAGDDTVSGGAGADMLSGGAGNDVYVVDNTGDKVIESVSGGLDGIQSSITFSLVSVGTVETLTLTGSGNIKGTGNASNNKLTGNTGANTLDGGAGNDMLNGGVGKDMLTGGAGKDTFFFTAALSAANSDKINDFSVADDTVRMENAVFAALKATGTLAESAFYAGAAAHDASDRIIYNKATGALSYDADGKGGTAAVQFATLGSGLALTHADFMVV